MRRRKEERGKREQPKKSRVYPVMAHLWSFAGPLVVPAVRERKFYYSENTSCIDLYAISAQ